jgi:TonB-dependent receptor-like protein/carboxypeptidase family protein
MRSAARRATFWMLFWSLPGMVMAQTPTILTGTVTTRADGLPVPGAVVSLVGSDVTVTTDSAGKYRLEIPPLYARSGSVQVKVDALGLAPKIYGVEISPAGPNTFDIALSLGFEEQVTVGSRAAGAENQKAVPVDIITQEQIATTGYAETTQVIQALAPSFNFPRPTITDGTDTVRPATLRGLGPDQVLVLVNGKRRHQSALVHLNGSIGRGSTGVDLNAIPVSAIDHIEVLRDGAAAQYGSDAIAGVINIVLKGGESRPALSTKFGLSTGSFVGNACTPDGLACHDGDTIDFSDGGDRKRQPDDCGGVPPSQSHESSLIRSARSDRRRRCGEQSGAGTQSSMGGSGYSRLHDAAERERAPEHETDTLPLRLRWLQPS